jgi:large conductance mechanosensitive channel
MANSGSGFFNDFKAFLLQGDVIDLATAVIIGGAFGKIVESFIADIITPALLNPAMKAAKVDDIAKLAFNGILYGKFLAALLNFIIIAFVIFAVLRAVSAAKKQMERKQAIEEAEAAANDPALEVQQRLAESLDRLTKVISAK